MNELLHKFKLGYEAELLLEKRGGGYEKVATVPIGSQALGVTQSDGGIAITAGGVDVVAALAIPTLSDAAAYDLTQTADFYVPLRAGMNVARGVGSPTFTRSTVATEWGYSADAVSGSAQVLLTIPAGVPCFGGARYVGNGLWSDRFADGSLIPDAQILGYHAQPSRTNSIWPSRDATHANFVKTGASAVLTEVGIDGAAASACLISATAQNAAVLWPLTLAAAVRSFSVYIKPMVLTGTVSITRDGGASWTDITSQLVAGKFSRVKIENSSILNPSLGILLSNAGDVIVTDYWQDEAGAAPSNPIKTTVAAANRGADALTYPKSGNLSDTAGVVTFSATRDPSRQTWRGDEILVSSGTAWFGYRLDGIPASRTRSYDGTNQTEVYRLISDAENIDTYLHAWSGTESVTARNTPALAVGTYDTTLGGASVISVGCDATYHADAYIRDIYIWQSRLSNAQCKLLLRKKQTTGLLVVGDSTVAAHLGQNSVSSYLTKPDGSLYDLQDVSYPGETIALQQTRMLAAAYGRKYALVQVGLNDLNPAEAASVALARYQGLINILTDSGALVVTSTMTPCKQRLIDLYGASPGATAYQKWIDMNAAISGTGANAITGQVATVTAHTTLLNDGSGNLLSQYEAAADHIHENNAARQIIAFEWKKVLTAVGAF